MLRPATFGGYALLRSNLKKPQRCRCRQIGCLRHEGQRLSAVAGLHSQIMVDPQAEQIETANANHYECPPNKGPHQQFVVPATEVLHVRVSRKKAATTALRPSE